MGMLGNALHLSFADSAKENKVIIKDLQVLNSTMASGFGVLLLFMCQCTRNSVLLDISTVANHHALKKGGSIFALFIHHGVNNTFFLYPYKCGEQHYIQG